MKSSQLYNYIYKRLNDITPIKADCGKLCDKACCKGDSDTGMYLFPYEEIMFSNTNHNFRYNIKKVKGKNLFICDGACDRNYRPLSCRIFPLMPYIDSSGKFSVSIDCRAKGICPIAYADELSNFDPEFIKRVKKVSYLLIRFDVIKKFIYELSEECNEYKNYFTL